MNTRMLFLIRSLRLIVVLLLLAGCAPFASPPTAPVIGQPAPPLALPTLQGATAALAEYRGRVVIVNFWASWCAPCVRETPRLVQLATQHRAAGLSVLGVNTLFQDSRAAVDEFAAQQQISYPVLVDEKGTTSDLWQARELPRTYVIDRNGTVRFVKLGEFTDQDFAQQVEPLLAAGASIRRARFDRSNGWQATQIPTSGSCGNWWATGG